MEDIVKFLPVVLILLIAVIKQIGKAKTEQSQKPHRMPIPDQEMNRDTFPVPEKWDDPFAPPPVPQKKINKQSHSSPDLPSKAKAIPPPIPQPIDPSTDEDSEFTIHSAEEARRAIIWSEILNRKYQ